MEASFVNMQVLPPLPIIRTPRENLAAKFDQCVTPESSIPCQSSPDSGIRSTGGVSRSNSGSSTLGSPRSSCPSRNSLQSYSGSSGRSTPTRGKELDFKITDVIADCVSKVRGLEVEDLTDANPSDEGIVKDREAPVDIMTDTQDLEGSDEANTSTLSSGYLNDYVDLEASMIARVKERRRPRHGKINAQTQCDETASTSPKFSNLPEIDRIPWNDNEVLLILRDGRTKEYSGYISVEMMQRLSVLLQRPLVRITREIQRLSSCLEKTGKHEVETAMKMILSRNLYDSCLQACMKASALYAMSGNTYKESKSARCGLRFSVGKFHRWLLDLKISSCVHDFAAIYVTALMENLLEEIVLLALNKDQLVGPDVLSLDVLEYGIAANPDLWGLLQPYEHLVCGRNSCGIPSLPRALSRSSSARNLKEGTEALQNKTLEQCFLTTNVDNISELGDLVRQALQSWHTLMAPPGGKANRKVLTMTSGALHTLYYFIKFSQKDVSGSKEKETDAKGDRLTHRCSTLLPPLIEWVRVVSAHVEHRFGHVIEETDIQQAARLLLPGVDCAPRKYGLEESNSARHLETGTCTRKLHNNMVFKLLTSGRPQLLQEAIDIGGKDKVNLMNDKGLTPLMFACIQGDESTVKLLVGASAKLNLTVPDLPLVYPAVHPETKHWTALTFAAVHKHIGVAQLLLDSGANVDGGVKAGEENFAETPLQLASAAGHFEIVCLLLSRGADPYLNTQNKNGMSYTYTTGGYNAFAMAAIHGHRSVLRKLLAQPLKSSSSSNILSLEEILEEGRSGNTCSLESVDSFRSRADQDTKVQQHDSGHETETETDNEYMTIDEAVLDVYNRKNKQMQKPEPKGRQPTKWQSQALQEALYHASENGFLDVALELRNLGVPWTLYCWGRCLEAAHNLRRKTIVQCLLKDFTSSKLMEEYNAGFICDCLPFMFQILRSSKNESVGQQLATIFTEMYGLEPMPPIHEFRSTQSTIKIDPRHVNNPELADIHFLIGDCTFYAHKLILVNASPRFRAMLTAKQCEGKVPAIELHNVKYHIFEYVIKFLYVGDVEALNVETADLIELLEASHFFMLEPLQRYCESKLAKGLNFQNSSSLYKHAKMNESYELMAYVEGFFLQNLAPLIAQHDSFKRLLFSSKLQRYGLVNGLLTTLSQRLESRLRNKMKCIHARV